MSDKERARKALMKGLLATDAAKEASRGLASAAEVQIKELGLDPEQLKKAAMALELLRSQRISAKRKIGENTHLSGTIDAKNKSAFVNITHEF